MARNGRTTRARKTRRGFAFWRFLSAFVGYTSLFVLLGTLAAIVVLASIFHEVTKDLPSPEQLVNYDPGGVTEIYATDKDPKTKRHIVLGQVYAENREFVPITRIPAVLKNATVAIEDERFYSHPGVDLKALARIVYVAARQGQFEQGGSTLTQQLARNVYLTRRRTITRKAQEMMLALQIEKNYSKEEILEMYLNEVNYGAGAYGVQAAARTYFGRSVGKLSLSQAALIAGLPQRPSELDPYKNKKAAIARRNVILAKMAQLGYITPKQAKVARSNGVFLVPQKKKSREFKAPYFTNLVIRQLVEKYGYDKVYKGGLKVYTTLNWRMQQTAERSLQNGVAGGRRARVTEGSLVSVEPRTGYIRALVGGVNFKKNQFNNAVQGRRQPGSAFKVFVYAAAFDLGRFRPSSTIRDLPTTFGRGRKAYSPQNYGGGYHGYVTIRQALTHSYNIPAVVVANEIGVRRVIGYARRMGIVSPLAPDLSLALGSHPVSPLEMACAYAVLANGGNRAQPMGIIRVLAHNGETLENNIPQVEQAVIKESTVTQLSGILQDVVTRGTAAGAAGIEAVSHAHGKTGTTNDNKDAWFVGYTPELCTAVWVCGVQRYEKNGQVVARYLPMSGVTGGHVCAPIWARFMRIAVPIQQSSGEPKPPRPEKLDPGSSGDPLGGIGMAVVPRPEPPPVEVARREPPRRRARWRDLFHLPRKEDREAAAPAPAASGEEPRPVTATADAGSASSAPIPPPILAAPAPVIRVRPERVVARGMDSPPEAPRRTVSTAPVPSPPAPRPVRMVTVAICVDSGRRATRWCPETVSQAFSAGRAPRGTCRIHRPRPGDG